MMGDSLDRNLFYALACSLQHLSKTPVDLLVSPGGVVKGRVKEKEEVLRLSSGATLKFQYMRRWSGDVWERVAMRVPPNALISFGNFAWYHADRFWQFGGNLTMGIITRTKYLASMREAAHTLSMWRETAQRRDVTLIWRQLSPQHFTSKSGAFAGNRNKGKHHAKNAGCGPLGTARLMDMLNDATWYQWYTLEKKGEGC